MSVVVGLTAPAVAASTPSGPPASPLSSASADRSTLLVRFRPGLSREAQRAVVRTHGAHLEKTVAGTGFFLVSSGARPAADLRFELAADPRVDTVEPNYLRSAGAAPDDLYYPASQSAYLDAVRLPEAWDLTTGADDLTLAIVDSGVDLDHPDLAGRLLPGWDFVGDDASPDDNFGHGTQVATIAAANTNNDKGMAGVAWQGKILPVKVLDARGAGTDAKIAAGITWAADHGADVISLSLGGPHPSQTVEEAIDHARHHDVVVVAAAGNDHDPDPAYPAALDGVVAVSAIDRGANLAPFSNYGPWIDLAAPGVDILAGSTDGAYRRVQGTSFAAPIVAGVALLTRARFPDDSAAQIVDRLLTGARDIGPLGRDDTSGSGLVDALGALGRPAPEYQLDPSTQALEPDNTPDRASALAGAATASLNPEGDVDWFTLDVPSTQWMEITLTPPAAGASRTGGLDLVFDLYGPNLRLLGAFNQKPVGGAEGTTWRFAPGRYYVRVRNKLFGVSPGPYELRATPVPQPLSHFDFRSHETWPLNAPVTSVAVGDVTGGDGAADVVVTTGYRNGGEDANRLVLFPQAGGTLAAPVRIGDGTSNYGDASIALGDLDGNGDLEVAVGINAGVELFRQEGGSLTRTALIPMPGDTRVEIGDVDGDGRQDLVAAVPWSGARLLRNRGDGGFDEIAVTSSRLAEVEVADMDGDGRDDIAALECPDHCDRLAVYTYRPGGGFSATNTPLSTSGYLYDCALGVGDANGDGRRDAFAGCTNSRWLRLAFQAADGTFPDGADVQLFAVPQALEGADLNGDGRADIVALLGDVTQANVLLGEPGGTLTPPRGAFIPSGGPYGRKALALGDVDGDGFTDLAAGTQTQNSGLFVLRQNYEDPDPNAGGEQLWVRDTTPADGSTQASPSVAPAVRFARPLGPNPLSSGSVSLSDALTGTPVAADASHDTASNSIVLLPRQPLVPGRPYEMRVSGLRDASGAVIPSEACCLRFRGGTTPAAPPFEPPVARSEAPTRSGYWMLSADGRVYPFGDAAGAGDAPTTRAVDLEPGPSGEGYWVLDATGSVYGFRLPYLGGLQPATLRPGEAATSLSATPTGQGYWIFTTAGRVFAFGDARFAGDMAAVALNAPVLDSIATPTGGGYYMVAADGGIFAFGDARFTGSMGDRRLNAPVQSLVPDPDGSGYWLVASDGGVFAFDAGFRGSMGDRRLNAPVTGMVPYGDGYLMVATDGGLFNFSDRPFAGSLGAAPPLHPVVSVAALP